MHSGNYRKSLPYLLALALLATAARADTGQYVIVVPVASMYSGPSLDSDVVSQAIYASTVTAIEENDAWVKVRTPEDAYAGWVPKSALLPLADDAGYASSGQIVEVRALMANIYREPDVTLHAPMLTAPFETRLEFAAFQPDDQGQRWLQVRLPDGRIGWIQHGDVEFRSVTPGTGPNIRPLSVAEMVVLGKRFLGLPYTWGGRSSFGYDCSGFVQMLMRQRGYYMPRDADVQAAWTGFVPVKRAELRAGDVLFFGSEGKITHTGMFIGKGQFIQATTHDHPVIQISPLNRYWIKLLVAQRRVKR